MGLRTNVVPAIFVGHSRSWRSVLMHAPDRVCAAPRDSVLLYSRRMERIKIEQHGFAGALWFAGWLFTLGLLHLPFWKGLLAIVMWPYYLGVALAAHLH